MAKRQKKFFLTEDSLLVVKPAVRLLSDKKRFFRKFLRRNTNRKVIGSMVASLTKEFRVFVEKMFPKVILEE